MRLPSLNALRTFEAAARHESFSRAGSELHVTHSAVSRRIGALEAELGVELFERRNRRVFLTQAGRRLLDSTRTAFRRIEATCTELRASRPTPLVLSCEPTLTQRWLIPRLPHFAATHPDIVVHVLVAGGAVDFERERVDIAIRRNDFVWSPEVFAETIFEERVGPVCAPTLVAGRSTAQLLSLPLIHSATRVEAWEKWAQANGLRYPEGPSQTFEHFYLSIEAAIAGLGIAIGPEPLVTNDIQSGRLVAPFGFSPNGFRYVLLSPTDISHDPSRAALLQWLREQGCEHAGR